MHSEIVARITAQSEHQIELQVCRQPCVGCDGRCGAFFPGSTDSNSVPVSKSHVKSIVDDLDDGGQVKVGVSVRTLIGLSSLVYLVPLVLMLLSAIACFRYLSQSDSAVAVSAGFGLIGGLLIVKYLLSGIEKNQAAETLFIRRDSGGV